MLHFLLVDDEPGHVIGFTRLLGKLRPGDTVSSARSGEEALRLCEGRMFDLIFTDIRMPHMTGLEFMEKLDPANRAKVVVLSGYDFFEYAQKALTFGAFGYLLKPVDAAKLQEVFARAEQMSERERHDRLRQQELAERIDRMEPAYSGKLLQAWIDGTISGERLTELKDILPLNGAGTAVCVRRKYSFGREEAGRIQSRLREYGDCFCFVSEHDDEELICMLGDGIDPQAAGRVFEEPELRLGVGHLSAGIGSRRDHLLEEAHISVREARFARLEQFYEEDQTVFAFGASHLDRERIPALASAAETALKEALRGGDEQTAKNALTAIFREWRSRPYPLPHRLRDKCKLLLVKTIEDHDILREGSLHDDFLREIEVLTEHAAAYSQLEGGALDVVVRAVRTIKEWKENHRHQLVQRCLAYIDEHYRSDISLESAAQRFGLSAGYFSQYFKTKLKINFTAYLNQVRLSKAKAMLEHETLRVYKIAEEVGYQDVKYFNRVFKKEFGMTPEEYRKTIRILHQKRG
ncbi:response regulator [Paenibacillus oralis]|uniref:Response regulator n=1 Tax=Paenibacillus oralis TaxID=2490856 RepID=A0A3P3UBZ1_9BACL|nr:response regulator [Paenibacillus oralis]RRJ65963.1 response regulator [Paenibacillus oralis]